MFNNHNDPSPKNELNLDNRFEPQPYYSNAVINRQPYKIDDNKKYNDIDIKKVD